MKDNFDISDSSSCLKNSSQTSECPIFNRKYFYILNNYILLAHFLGLFICLICNRKETFPILGLID